MNHHRFRLFFSYMIDLQNLRNTNELHVSHPLSDSQTVKPDKDLTAELQTAFENLNVDSERITSNKENLHDNTKKTTPSKDNNKTNESCPICGKTIKSKSGLTRHLKSIHKDQDLPLQTGLKCMFCDKYCKNQSGLKRHQEYKHKDEMPRPS